MPIQDSLHKVNAKYTNHIYCSLYTTYNSLMWTTWDASNVCQILLVYKYGLQDIITTMYSMFQLQNFEREMSVILKLMFETASASRTSSTPAVRASRQRLVMVSDEWEAGLVSFVIWKTRQTFHCKTLEINWKVFVWVNSGVPRYIGKVRLSGFVQIVWSCTVSLKMSFYSSQVKV